MVYRQKLLQLQTISASKLWKEPKASLFPRERVTGEMACVLFPATIAAVMVLFIVWGRSRQLYRESGSGKLGWAKHR